MNGNAGDPGCIGIDKEVSSPFQSVLLLFHITLDIFSKRSVLKMQDALVGMLGENGRHVQPRVVTDSR